MLESALLLEAARFRLAISSQSFAQVRQSWNPDDQNPRSAYALRFVAASLAKQGRLDHAAAAVREVLSIEPQLTVTKLRPRLMFIEEKIWNDYSAALRLAGLPE